MHRLLLLCALAATVALAQVPSYPTGCPRCGVISYVDLPQDGATVSQTSFYLAGWGFECESGRAAHRVDVFYEGDDGYFHPLVPQGTLYWGLSRPDVRNAYAAHCPNVPDTTGWHVYLTNPPPLGTRRITVNVWREPYFEGHTRTITVVP